MLRALIFILEWRDLLFSKGLVRQIFEKNFRGRFIYHQSFCRKFAERRLPKKCFPLPHIFVSMPDLVMWTRPLGLIKKYTTCWTAATSIGIWRVMLQAKEDRGKQKLFSNKLGFRQLKIVLKNYNKIEGESWIRLITNTLRLIADLIFWQLTIIITGHT